MILGALVIIVIGALIFNYFRGVEPAEEVEELPVEEIKLVEEEGKLVPEGLPLEYEVKEGDDLWKIAEKFYGSGYNWVDIVEENQMGNPDVIYVGQKLTVPRTAVIKLIAEKLTAFGPTIEKTKYVVVKGDHLWGIAVRAYGDGFQWTKIVAANNIDNPDVIEPGMELTIPR